MVRNMGVEIVSDDDFRNLKERIIKDKEETLARGDTIRTARNRMYGRLTAFSGIEGKVRAYTESQLEEIFEIMEIMD